MWNDGRHGATAWGFIFWLGVVIATACSAPQPTHVISSEPVVRGSGPLNGDMLDRYQTLAVFDFEDAPGAPRSGAILSELVTNELLKIGFNLVERVQLKHLFEEQRLELQYGDEKTVALKVGKLTGAKAIVIGTVDRWPREDQPHKDLDVTFVALSLEILDVQTGMILYAAQAYYSRPLYVQTTPQRVAIALLRNLSTHLSISTGLWGTGLAGFTWNLTEQAGRRGAVVTHIDRGLPADQMGLKVGDRLLSCNGSPAMDWQTRWQSFRACRVEAGQILTVEVARGEERLTIRMPAVNRMELARNTSLLD